MKLSDFENLVDEIHPKKNGKLNPKNYSAGSHKKIWWKCSVAEDHVWLSEIRNRTLRKYGCPYCKGKKPSTTNNLQIKYPEILKDWNYEKNEKLKPTDVLPSSTIKVWWKCDKGHEYKHSVNQKVSKKIKCPECSGYKIGKKNNLEYLFPNISKEWDYKKNHPYTPNKVTAFTHKKYWFKCKLNHSFKTSISTRTSSGSNCPKCTNQSSQPEIRIFCEFKYLFNNTIHKHKFGKIEFDIFIPPLNLAIEFDGSYFHKDKEKEDMKKNEFCNNKGINIIRVRQSPLKPISNNDIIVPKRRQLIKTDIDKIFIQIKKMTILDSNKIFEKYIYENKFMNNILFEEHNTYFPLPRLEKSFLKTHPQFAKNWDYKKNYPLMPEHFTYGSERKVWWKCQHGHSSYFRTIQSKGLNKAGCPICNKERLRRGLKRKVAIYKNEKQLQLF